MSGLILQSLSWTIELSLLFGNNSPCVYYAENFEQQPASNWRGVFSVSSYTQFFNVDTDIVLNRLISSFYPMGADFFSKIDANPDL